MCISSFKLVNYANIVNNLVAIDMVITAPIWTNPQRNGECVG
jgi:hypothetical protein